MSNTKTKSTVSTMEHIRILLDQGRAQEALNLIEHLGQNSPVMENARGVCLLRLGRFEEAILALREITFQGYVCIPRETPAIFQTNFATALLLANHKDAAINIIHRLDEKQHPAIARLKSAIERWKKGLSPLLKMRCAMGFYPACPVLLDFAPGDLE